MAIVLQGLTDPIAKSDEYAVRGFIIRRNNFDGSVVTPARMLSGVGPFDLTLEKNGMTILDQGRAPLVIRTTTTSGQRQERKMIDFTTGVVNLAAVTVAELALRLSAAGFTDINITIDNMTGAVNVTSSDPTAVYVQIFGILAGAVGFGGCKPFRGFGSILWNYITHDDIVTVAPTVQKADDTTVDQAGGGLGTLSRIIVPGKVTGMQYAINTKPRDNVIRQMLEGGSWTLAVAGQPDQYSRPITGEDVGNLTCEWWVFYPQYKANSTSSVNEITKMVLEHVYKGTGSVGDASRGASALANFNYTLDCSASYDGIDGGSYSQPEELDYPTVLWTQQRLIEAASDWNLSDLIVIPVTDFQFTSSVSVIVGQTIYDFVRILPENANAYTVSIATPTILTDTQITWEQASTRLKIFGGTITGTEDIAVTITNDDGSSVQKILTISVSSI